MLSKKDFSKLMALLGEAYRTFQVSESMLAVWYELLCDIDYKELLRAVKAYIATSEYPPTIAGIRKLAIPVYEISPAEGWQELNGAIAKFGVHRKREALESVSSVTRKVLEVMGWETVCLSEEGEGVMRAHFIKLYEMVAEKARAEKRVPAMLLGNSNPAKALAGHFTGRKLIGE